MVAVNYNRLIKGPAFAYTAAESTAEWAPVAGAPAGWTLFGSGLVSPEGINITLEQELRELQVADRMAPTEVFRSSQKCEIVFSVYDLHPEVFELYSGNVASASGVDFTQTSAVSKTGLLIVGKSPVDIAKRAAWWFPRAYVKELGEIVTSREGLLTVEFTFGCLFDAPRSAVMKYSVQP